jgi:hypothetical protein
LVASLQRLEAEVSREAATQRDCADEQRELERELEQWRLRTEERLDVLRRNNMSGSESRDMALSGLRRIQHDLVRRISLTEQQHHEAASLQEDLRNGRFHVSADWVRQLTEADVAHQTGESYLREAAPAERERLLQQLPFLPYAILMTTASLAELPEKLKTEVRRGVAPFLTYEGLRELAGRDESERDVREHDETGHDVAGHGVAGRDVLGRDEPGHDVAGHGVAGRDVLGRDEPGHGVSEAGILPAAWDHRAYMMRPGSLLLATLYNREALAPESVGRLLEETAHALSRLTASIENLRLAHQTATRDLQLLEAMRIRKTGNRFRMRSLHGHWKRGAQRASGLHR